MRRRILKLKRFPKREVNLSSTQVANRRARTVETSHPPTPGASTTSGTPVGPIGASELIAPGWLSVDSIVGPAFDAFDVGLMAYLPSGAAVVHRTACGERIQSVDCVPKPKRKEPKETRAS